MKSKYAFIIRLFLSIVLATAIIMIGENVYSISVGGSGFLVMFAIIFTLFLASDHKEGVVAGNLDLSALPGKLKDYALADTKEILTQVMVDGLGFTDYFETLSGITDEVPLNELVIGSILQPGGKDTFNPTANAVKFKSRIGKTRPMKVDLTFTPTKVLGFWKSYLGKVHGGKIDPYEIPFEAFIMDRIIRAAQRDIRMSALFKGVYNAAGTSAIDTCNGLGTKITLELGTNIPSGNASAGAPITVSNALDQVRLIVDKVMQSPDYIDVPMVALMSHRNSMNYNLDYQATNQSLPYNNEFKQVVIDGTNIAIQPEVGLTGSDRIIITPRENLFWLTDEENATNNLIVEKEKRNINILMDINCAPEFGIAEIIWCNDYEDIV